MTVAELTERLQAMPPDAVVYVVDTSAFHQAHEPACDVTLMDAQTVWIDS